MNEVQQIEFLINSLNKANKKGVYDLQTSTTLGMICNELLNSAKINIIKKQNEHTDG